MKIQSKKDKCRAMNRGKDQGRGRGFCGPGVHTNRPTAPKNFSGGFSILLLLLPMMLFIFPLRIEIDSGRASRANELCLVNPDSIHGAVPMDFLSDAGDVCQIETHLKKEWNVEPELAETLSGLAQEYEHGVMVLAIMAVESMYQPELDMPYGKGLGQVNARVHLSPFEIRSARDAGRANILDECGINDVVELFDPELNFCASHTIYASLLDRKGTPEQALKHYVGSTGNLGTRYARRVLAIYEKLRGAVR